METEVVSVTGVLTPPGKLTCEGKHRGQAPAEKLRKAAE